MTMGWLPATVLLALAGCTSLGGTVRGDFTCRAAQGTCAPLSINDAVALAAVAGDRSGPAAPERTIAGAAARSGERLLSVLLPAHVDADGVLHDAATVHVVAEPARWRPVTTSQDQLPSTASPRSLPPSLREVIAGASALAVEGLELLPSRAPQPFPSAAALEAARAGHRIPKPMLADALKSSSPKPDKLADPPIRPLQAAPLVAPTPDREHR